MLKEKFINSIFNWGVMAAIVAVAFPELSFAQGSIGESFQDLRVFEVANVPPLVNAVAFTAGAVLGISGALKLKAHAENPASEKLAPGIARLLAGGAVAALPVVVGTAFETLHINQEIQGVDMPPIT